MNASPLHKIVYNERDFNGLFLKLENIDIVMPKARRIRTNAESFYSDSVHDFTLKSMGNIVYLIEFS